MGYLFLTGPLHTRRAAADDLCRRFGCARFDGSPDEVGLAAQAFDSSWSVGDIDGSELARLRPHLGRRLVHIALEPDLSHIGTAANNGATPDAIFAADLPIETLAVLIGAEIGLRPSRELAPVDVIVGGQYGSEGKGHIAFELAREYDVLVRVGGPNAGHKVVLDNGSVYTHNQLPAGTLAGGAKLLIGAGATLDVSRLMREIADCGVTADRLTIDRKAMVISEADIHAEKGLVTSIGSTGKGGGSAACRRIQRGADVTLAESVPALEPYLGDVTTLLNSAYFRGERVLLEGTQGTLLSLYHGAYPHVTGRETTAAGCLGEAGISPLRVRKIIMVCRSYPIRAGLGPMGEEVTWVEVAARAQLRATQLENVERGSISGKLRRVAEFNWVDFSQAVALNCPTDIALTFADYISSSNAGTRRFEQLTSETLAFIGSLERVGGAPVSLISTGFHPKSIIDRRTWASPAIERST